MTLRRRITLAAAATFVASAAVYAISLAALSYAFEKRSALFDFISASLPAAIGIAAGAAFVTHLNKILLASIHTLLNDVRNVQQGSLQQVTIPPEGSGELHHMAITLNTLLATTSQRDENHRRSVNYVRAMLDAIPGHVSWVSRDLKYLGVNDSLAKAHGLPNDEFVGKEVGFREGKDTPLRDFLEHFFESDDGHAQIELGGDPDDENTRIFLISARKYGNDREAVLVGVDVTERRRLARQVDQERQRALHAAKMSTLGEMAGGIAHEINNPVTIIYGKAKQIQKFKDRPDYLDFVQKSATAIEATALRIAKIVKGLRTFARDGDRDPFEATPIGTLVEEAVALCEMRLKGQGVVLEVDTGASELHVECRPTQVSQVLLNLIGNAHDAIASLSDRWIRVTARDLGHDVELAVEDSGVGIPEAVAARIFNPFFTTKEVGNGTGLGLSISRGIAETHGGYLGLDRQNAHTRFVMVLPKRQRHSDESALPPPPMAQAS